MAPWRPFCDLVSLFSSVKYDQEYELSFWNEIYGCVNYLNLPYETVMNLPVYIRKFWIQKHNQAVEEEKRAAEGSDKMTTVGGESLNAFARTEMGLKG